jgi:hypothetical protein
MKVVDHLDQRLLQHAASPCTGGAKRLAVDQAKTSARPAHIGHSVKPGGAGPYDGYIDLSPHSNVFLLLQEIVPGDQ